MKTPLKEKSKVVSKRIHGRKKDSHYSMVFGFGYYCGNPWPDVINVFLWSCHECDTHEYWLGDGIPFCIRSRLLHRCPPNKMFPFFQARLIRVEHYSTKIEYLLA